MDLTQELRIAAEAVDLESFRLELLNAVQTRAPDDADEEELDFAFVCEVGARLSEAEEFQDFIPCHGIGTGSRSRKIRVDGYEIDEADDSIRLLIADFKGQGELETITKTRAESLFSQLRAFIEESVTGKIWASALGESVQTRELSSTIEQKHLKQRDGGRSVTRYRLYLITDSTLSDRVKDLPGGEIDGVLIEYHVWDIGRLRAVSTSLLGTEELDIDFTQFTDGGLPCLQAGQTDDYDGYLCVIPGDALAELYDRYGSRLLEGNVRSFLNTTVKVNKGIQATIRAEPDKFFVFNNGISATATSAVIETSKSGSMLLSARYLQIVNGGQTTASLHIAKRKDKADLSKIQVQMKLSVVRAKDNDMLDQMIQKIARYSNSQNKVTDADFFSNHPFHIAIERRSRKIHAPRLAGAQFNTFWFYERARGQYVNAQAKLNLTQKKQFQRDNPRTQIIVKTDLAKFENSWRQLPHIVSRHAQKNFLIFAEYVGKEYGENGAKFDNDIYYKELVAKAIIFKFLERMVSEAKATWYGGDYRAQIVTYSIAKLVNLIEQRAPRDALGLMKIWNKQGVSVALANQLEAIAKLVSSTITVPPVAQMNVGEWCKKEDCWIKVMELDVDLTPELRAELVSKREIAIDRADAEDQTKEDQVIDAVMEVVGLAQAGCWKRLLEWSKKYSPLFGKESDLVRIASQGKWVPSDKQANVLVKVLQRLESEGFKRN